MRITETRALWNRLQGTVHVDAEVVRYAVKVTVWGRWVICLASVFQMAYRPGFWFPQDIEHLYLLALLVAVNGLVHFRLLTNRPVGWSWMLALSAMDLALIASNAIIRGGFESFVFLAYYPALGAFAVVFPSFRLGLVWATVAAACYAAISVFTGAGLDLESGDEKVLVARLVLMYLIAVAFGLIVRFERESREAALSRERRLLRERIEDSQAIHDTTAQTAYMIGLGIDGAMRLAGDSNPRLTERLAATSALAKSAMWELRRPIDMGRVLEGRELGDVLNWHTDTFARITSVPAVMVQNGREPPLDIETRTGLLTIAHNALANAFLHARAGRVEVRLDFGAGRIVLSISDDGIGLPEDFAEKGRGFDGMKAEAEAMGGRLIIESGGPAGGTAVTCSIPRNSDVRGA